MTLHYSLLDEALIGARLADGQRIRLTLPALFVALAEDRIRDFPALRPHQRHPWHAFLVQLAAIALHHANRTEPFADESEWRSALLALTPDDPDGAAWCLISPINRPAFLQAPVPEGSIVDWYDDKPTPDSLDILVTSKNHDLKQQRISLSKSEDWIFALVSLQTSAPYPGRGNFGVCRMNGGSSSRPGIGVVPPGRLGSHWLRDLRIALSKRPELVEKFGYANTAGTQLLWLEAWNGKTAKSFSSLDPFFIEISRRIRLSDETGSIRARRTTSASSRISKDESRSRKGNTGDLWTPVKSSSGESLGISGTGFHYRRMVELLFSSDYRKPPAQDVLVDDGLSGLTIIARAIAGGQSTTDGYHERRIPISPKIRSFMIKKSTDTLARIAEERVSDISKVYKLLRKSLAILFANGTSNFSDSVSKKADLFAKPFEQYEDARFFDGPLGLNEHIEADDPDGARLAWYVDMAKRAEDILRNAFEAGPRSGEQRYRARAAALGRFHGGLRKEFPTLATHYEERSQAHNTPPLESVMPVAKPEPPIQTSFDF